MFTTSFWRAAAERAVSTAAQSALLVIGAEQVNAISGVEWTTVAGFAAGGAVLSLLKALAASQTGDSESPSLGGGEVLEDEQPYKPTGYGDGI